MPNYSNVIYAKRDSKIFISNKPYTLIATDIIVHINCNVKLRRKYPVA